MKKTILIFWAYLVVFFCPVMAGTEDLASKQESAATSLVKVQEAVSTPLVSKEDGFDLDILIADFEKEKRAYEIAMLKAETDFQFIMGMRHRMVKKFQETPLSDDEENYES